MDVSDAAKIALVEASGTQGSTVLGKSANRSGAKQRGLDARRRLLRSGSPT